MWKDLSIQQKSEVMKMAISQGLTDLNEIKKMYDASIPNIEASSVNNTYGSVPYNPSPKDVRYDDGGIIFTPELLNQYGFKYAPISDIYNNLTDKELSYIINGEGITLKDYYANNPTAKILVNSNNGVITLRDFRALGINTTPQESELDWSPESWFSKRVAKPDGTKYTQEDVEALESHLQEYRDIERTSKADGTWLKMPDGSTWLGDPRSWIMMQSKAFKKNYSDTPWYTGQAEWPTTYDYGKGEVTTNKVTRAPYYNGQMWFSDNKLYGDTFANFIDSKGLTWRHTKKKEKHVKGNNFLAAIPKEGKYRHLQGPPQGESDAWQSMPFTLTSEGLIKRLSPSEIIKKSYLGIENSNLRKDGRKVLTDDVANLSKDLGDEGLFLDRVNDGAVVRKAIGNEDKKAYPTLPAYHIVMPATVNEFISQPGFTDKVKFIEGNNGNFDINDPYKYSYNEVPNLYNNALFGAYGGPLGNIYKGRGNKPQQIYVSSPSIRKRISNWEGESMYKPAPDTGKVNNPFEKEDAAFWSTIPTNIRPYLTQDMLDALYSTSYNIGSGNFKKRVVPELKKFFIDGTGSIEAIKNSMYGTRDKEAGMSGLRTRRATERAMFENAFNAEYPNGYRINRTPNLPVERTSQKTGWDKNKSAKENLDSTLYIDPKAPIYEALTKAGVHFMTTNPSGYRTPQQQKRFKTKNSQHTHKREDGTGWAMDATPGYITENGKTRRLTWDEFRSELTHPALQRYFAANGIGVYDETTPAVMKETGATGQHFHIGRDAYGPKGTMTTTYNNWVSKFRQPAITMDTESPVFHTAANDLQWQPTIVASSRQEDIAPLLVQNNKPLIVEPLEDTSSTPRDFSAIWDQIFPKVENTQEEFNPLLDPSTQFTALQSRPRYQMKPTPIINMPVSNGDNDYMLFKPLAKGGNLFENGSFMIKELPKAYVEAYPNMKVTTPKGQSVTLQEAYTKWGDTPINKGDVPHLTDFLLQQNTEQPERKYTKPLQWLTDEQKFRLSNLAMGTIWRGKLPSTARMAHLDMPIGGPAQATYLLPRDIQEKKFLEFGYQLGEKGDYGLVRRAVGDRDFPVFQRTPDDASRGDLILIGNTVEHPELRALGNAGEGNNLVHAGHYPSAYYYNTKDGRFYVKSWDLNDYGGGTGASSRYDIFRRAAADFLDYIGSPVVTTTGYKRVSPNLTTYYTDDYDSMDIIANDQKLQSVIGEALKLNYIPAKIDSTYRNGTLVRNITDFGFFGGPEITVTPK